ncbi:MAG TPA: pentapeptide repeat-containing protein [Caulobacteraceae bacterium]
MTQFSTARAAMNRSKPPRYSEAELIQALAAHERFTRGEPGGQRAVWRFVQAPGYDFSARLMAGADLTGANLKAARLVRANLERACLQLADLREADASEANFKRADIRGVSLRHANLNGATFDDADMSQAILSPRGTSDGFRLVERAPSAGAGPDDVTFEVDFTNCAMRRVRLTNAKLNRANFTGAYLADADLAGADLRGARFRGAVLTGALLGGAKIDPDALKGCVVDPSPRAIQRAPQLMERLEAADIWVETGGANGDAADLDDEDLRPLGAAFAGRRLTAISARRVCAVGMSFAGAQLQGGRFDDADLRDVDFTGADLRGASFRGARLRYARFQDVDMRPLPLTNGGVRLVDLTGADHADDCFATCRQT